MVARAVTVPQLVAALSTIANQPVIDETALSGSFNAELEWRPESVGEPRGVSLFTAVQEQLGLKLVAATGPVDVLVIDAVRGLVSE